jgi:protein-tyrosine phosphatase
MSPFTITGVWPVASSKSSLKHQRVLFVCMGNICRSPSAEVIFRQLVDKRGFSAQFTVASAGTDSYHVGHGADKRSLQAAQLRGYNLSQHCAQQLDPDHINQFDWLIAMDSQNLRRMQGLWPKADANRMTRLLTFCPGTPTLDVPDPYYGGEQGFNTVLDLLECGCAGLLDHILAL